MIFIKLGKLAYSNVTLRGKWMMVNRWKVRRLFWRFFVITGNEEGFE